MPQPLPLALVGWLLFPSLAAQSVRNAPPPRAAAGGARILAPVHELLPSQPWDLHEYDVTAIGGGDLDGDGDLDAVLGLCLLGDWGDNPVRNTLLLNQGGGRFRDAFANLPDAPDIPFDIGSADVEGDGDLDLLLTNSYSPGADHLYSNQGHGRFVDASAQLVPGSERGSVRFGDVDGDGDPDVLFPRPASGVPELHENDGTGRLSLSPGILPAGSNLGYGRLGDVDRDGDLDVLFSRSGATTLWSNDGTGSFTDVSSGRVPTASGVGLFDLGDIDADLDLDLAAFGMVLKNDGSGTFTVSPSPSGLTSDLALEDVDGDGDLDLFGPTALALNGGTGVFSNASGQLPGLPVDRSISFEPGDWDGDGDGDALAAEQGEYLGTLSRRAGFLLLNDGQGSFTDSRALDEFPPAAFSPATFGPLNGDSFADLVLQGNGHLDVHPGDGTGLFGAPFALANSAPTVYALELADLEPNGSTDIVAAGEAGVKVYFGPWLAQAATPVTSEAYLVQPGDFDGDGDLDLVTSEAAVPTNRLLLNGGGLFTLASTAAFPRLPGSPTAIDVLDAEGDGDLDVVFAQGSVKLYLNAGAAVFTDASAPRVPAGPATGVAAGDLDGDGAHDLLSGSWSDQRLLRNDGSGFFTSRPDLLSPQPAPYGHALLDVDLDGDLDALRGGYAVLLENDGSGRLTPAGAVGPAWNPIVGDADGDGDPDVLNSDFAYSEFASGPIYRNHTRQVTWQSLPSIGEDLVIEIAGPPFEPFTLYTADSRAEIRTPSGTSWLDPATTQIAAQGLLGPQGRSRVLVPIPPAPALLGTTRYWQALVGSAARFTNLEATAFGDL